MGTARCEVQKETRLQFNRYARSDVHSFEAALTSKDPVSKVPVQK